MMEYDITLLITNCEYRILFMTGIRGAPRKSTLDNAQHRGIPAKSASAPSCWPNCCRPSCLARRGSAARLLGQSPSRVDFWRTKAAIRHPCSRPGKRSIHVEDMGGLTGGFM